MTKETKEQCDCLACQAEREIEHVYAKRGISGLCLFMNNSISEAPPEVTFARVREAVHMLVRQRRLEDVSRLCREMMEFASTIGRDEGLQVMINQTHLDVTSHIMAMAINMSRDIGKAMGSLMLVVSNQAGVSEGETADIAEASPDSFKVDTPMHSGKPVVH